ncbi:MAG: aadK [Brevibacillus sp.]|nr:aadK [Brevibacillus sp.]
MMQKPEDMELFPSELGNWFSYIILFEDGNKLDLTLIPINETEDYFTNSDGLVKNYKFINRDLLNEDWEALLSTYSENNCQNMWQSLLSCYELFRKNSIAVAESLGYEYPVYDEAITKYTKNIYHSLM